MDCLFIPGPVLGAGDKALMKTKQKTLPLLKHFKILFTEKLKFQESINGYIKHFCISKETMKKKSF